MRFSVIVSDLFIFENIISSVFNCHFLKKPTHLFYFDFLHGHIQHATVLDEKTLFNQFKRVTGGKNMDKYEEMSRFIEACTPLYRVWRETL